jgi:hypothetical protein
VFTIFPYVSRGSSGSIVSGYELDNQAIEVRSPAEARGFSSILLCPDRLWGPPSLLYSGYRGPFSGDTARPGRDADHSAPSIAEVDELELYLLSSQAPAWRVVTAFIFPYS